MCNRLWGALIALIVAQPAAAVELFWNDETGIHRVLRDDPQSASLLFDTFATRGIAVGAADEGLFWSDVLPLGSPLPGGVIRTGSRRGGPIVNVVQHLTSPSGVALDERHGRIYWTDLGDAAIPSAVFTANRDGTDVQRIISGPALSEIAGIAIDARHDKLYFTYVNPLLDSLFAGGIARADLDGSHFEPIVGGLLQPQGIAVDSDGGGVYWADPQDVAGHGKGIIAAADLDGGNRRTVLGGLAAPFGVALDLSQQNVYWTDTATGKIQRTDMSGILPYFQDVVTGLTAPTALAIAPQPAEFLWAVNADGLWSVGSNWATGIEPNGIGVVVRFGSVITAPRTVSIDSPRTVGVITFDNANAYTLAGPAMLTIDGPAPAISVVQGSHTIAGPWAIAAGKTLAVQGPGTITLSGPQSHGVGAALSIGSGAVNLNSDGGPSLAVANAATLNFGSTQHLASLNIGATGTTRLVAGGNKVLVTEGLAIDAGGVLDLANNDAVVQASVGTRAVVLASVSSQIASGAGALAWNGSGINSSAAAGDPEQLTGLGVMLNDTGLGGPYHTSFSGQPVDENSILVKFTYYGDADLSGVVDGTDYALIDNGFNAGLTGWFNGDFDYSGQVDGTDYALIDNAFNSQGAPLGWGNAATVPEPRTLVLGAVCLVALVGVVRRAGRRGQRRLISRSPLRRCYQA